MRYPVILIPDEQGGFVVEYPDFPFVHSAGDTEEEALREALDGVESGIAFFFDERLPVPLPSKPKAGQKTVVLPVVVAAKVLLHNEMLAQGVKKAELARRLNIAPPNVERIFRVRHKTRFETIEAALACLGKRLELAYSSD
ncbi:MAG: type II toxin-antitoxin system HicB family antitoxin [Syntrophorhabdaceae bacterium]|nr:type II toxin-antitoxin system HicB family antitoxin [Syntrophorhabdaceae bacterium]